MSLAREIDGRAARPGPSPAPSEPGERIVGSAWLPRIRWVGLALVLLLVLLGEAGAGVGAVPLAQAAIVLGVGALTNGVLTARHRHLDDRVVGAILAVDVALLTLLLAATGGDANPFSLLYVFPVVLGALFVRPAVTWALFLLATAAYASLFWLAPSDLHLHDEAAMRGHLVGMFVAWVLAAGLVTFAVGRVRAAGIEADQRLARARTIEERSRRLASLATLAAGAAHELGSPLSTILVVGRELERQLPDPRHQRDLALVRSEVLRCQDIVALLSADVGAGIGEASRSLPVRALLDAAVGRLPAGAPVEVVGGDEVVQVPVELVAQVLRRLIGNARDAGPPGSPIRLEGRVDAGGLRLTVEDHGPGMSPEVLDRSTEPFFTTREGDHRGLGLYFVHSVVDQLGGTFTIDSAVGRGTTVTVRLPVTAPGTAATAAATAATAATAAATAAEAARRGAP